MFYPMNVLVGLHSSGHRTKSAWLPKWQLWATLVICTNPRWSLRQRVIIFIIIILLIPAHHPCNQDQQTILDILMLSTPFIYIFFLSSSKSFSSAFFISIPSTFSAWAPYVWIAAVVFIRAVADMNEIYCLYFSAAFIALRSTLTVNHITHVWWI